MKITKNVSHTLIIIKPNEVAEFRTLFILQLRYFQGARAAVVAVSAHDPRMQTCMRLVARLRPQQDYSHRPPPRPGRHVSARTPTPRNTITLLMLPSTCLQQQASFYMPLVPLYAGQI